MTTNVNNATYESIYTNRNITFYDFSHTDLHLSIAYDSIINIRHQRVVGLSDGGLEITSKNGKRSVFVVEDVEGVKGEIEGRKG